MSYEPTDEGGNLSDLEDAANNNDIVTNDELQEMHPDLNMNEIAYKFAQDEAELNAQNPNPEPEEPRYAARKGMKTYRSGPKGVIADYNEAVLKQKALRIDDKLRREEKVYMKLGGTNNPIKPFKLKYNKNKSSKSESKHDSDSELDSDDEDDEAMRLYKQQKLEQIEKYRPKYGNCMEVTAWTFEEKVENAPKDVFTVMHVYQDYMERCQHMNRALSELAKAYPHVQFLRARSDRIALDEYPEIGLPTLIIWKNGDQLQNHIAMQTLVETPFTAKIIEQYLIENNVLVQSVEMIEKPTESTKDEFIDKYGTKSKGKDKRSLRTKLEQNDDDSDSALDID